MRPRIHCTQIYKSVIMMLSSVLVTACGPSAQEIATLTAAAWTATATVTATPTITPSPSPAPTATLTPSPTPFGGGKGEISANCKKVGEEGFNLLPYTIDPETGELNPYVYSAVDGSVLKFPDIPDLKNLGQFQQLWSLDQTQILILPEKGGAYLVKADGSDFREVNDFPSDAGEFGWSSDSKRIAFAAGAMRNREIYLLDAETATVTRLTRNGRQDSDPEWSPDGSLLAFVSKSLGSGFPAGDGLYIVSADGTDSQTRLTEPVVAGEVSRPVWSPNGKQLVMAGWLPQAASDLYQAYLVNADGTGLTRLTILESNLQLISPSSIAEFPVQWSPDGTQMILSVSDLSTQGNAIFIMRADGTDLRQISPKDYDCPLIWWS